MLHSNGNELIIASHNNMDESDKHVEWKKPDIKYILQDSVYIEFKNMHCGATN